MRSRWKSHTFALTAALGLLAFFAASAQAEPLKDGGKAGKFKVEGSSALAIGVRFILAQEGKGQFLVEGKNAYLECSKGTAEGEGVSESEITLTILFKECSTFEDTTKTELTACKIKGGSISGGFRGKAKLHEGNLYILFSGTGQEEEMGAVEFESELCSLGFKAKIKGSLVGKVDNGNEAVTHLIEFSKAIQQLFQVSNGVTIEGDKLRFASAQLFFTNSWIVELGGAHVGRNWSVI